MDVVLRVQWTLMVTDGYRSSFQLRCSLFLCNKWLLNGLIILFFHRKKNRQQKSQEIVSNITHNNYIPKKQTHQTTPNIPPKNTLCSLMY